jgi:hypothetical protein
LDQIEDQHQLCFNNKLNNDKMKAIYKKTLSILTFIGGVFMANSQNLDSMPQAQRDSLLISTAKEVVLRYGPGYYREDKKPVIKRSIYPKFETDQGKNAGRLVFGIKFFYDKTKEQLDKDYAAAIGIWGDTGNPYIVHFGNGWGRLIPEGEWESNTIVKQIPYQEIEIIPGYDLDHPEKKEPKNIDELRRKGYEEIDGQWIKTRKDVPPNTAILKREGYEEKNGQWVKTKEDVNK